MRGRWYIVLLIAVCAVMVAQGQKRRGTPVNTPATQTQAINQFEGDTARANAERRARLIQVQDADGNIMLIDSVTGDRWVDSAALMHPHTAMMYPLWHSVTVGVDIWDAVMRATGQDWGLGGVWASVSMHNRYMPVIEMGMGQCTHRSQQPAYRYWSGVAPFFKIGIDYNFLYNSSPDYKFLAGIRYGFSPFSYEVTDATVNNGYWHQQVPVTVPSQKVTAQYFEVLLGLRVKLWKGLAAGWSIKFHRLLSEGHPPYGKPWYIPGYGSRGPSFAASFSLSYTIDLHRKTPTAPEDISDTSDQSDTSAATEKSDTSDVSDVSDTTFIP